MKNLMQPTSRGRRAAARCRSKLPAAIEQLRPFFGWPRDSEMPRLYGRTYVEAQVAKVWRDDFDVRVEFLRSVP